MVNPNWKVYSAICFNLPFIRPISSLSAHSPPDPFAYPKYSVSLFGWDDAINNLTATAILKNLGSEPSQDHQDSLINPNSFSTNDEPNVRHTLMRSASGQAFLCALPPLPSSSASPNSHITKTPAVDSSSTEVEDLERKKERDRIEQEGLKNGLNLISSLKDRCIYTRLGWFTYSFCYGKGEIRQFHGQMVPGYNFPQEDPNQDIYVLGFHLDHPQNPHHQARLEGSLPAPALSAGEGELTSLGRNRFSSSGGSMHGSISDVLRDESAISSSEAKEEEEFQQKRYLVQRWDGGTTCDMTGKHRSVEVQFHCSTLGSDHIALVRETAICEYLLVVHTPRLCSEPLFLDGGSRPGVGAGETVANIGCQPVLTDEEIEKWKASENSRKNNQKQDESATKLKSLEETPLDQERVMGSKQVTKPGAVSKESHISSTEKVSDAPQTQDESLPFSSPDQILLGDTESTASKTTRNANSKSPAGQPDQDSPRIKGKTGILEVDPITVYFDSDSGKLYLDDPPTEKRSSDHRRDSGTQSAATADGKNNQATNAEQQTSEGKAGSPFDQANDNDSEPEFNEIAKALKESLAALLKDLRADNEGNEEAARRMEQNNPNQARPRTLAEVLASLKQADASLPGSTIKKLRQPQNYGQENGARSKTNREDLKKLSTESHAKLVEMYQLKFDMPEESNMNQPTVISSEQKAQAGDDKEKKMTDPLEK